jgi:hypothetical protein
MAAVLAEPALEGFDVRERRGKESITLDGIREGLAAIRWTALTKPAGLLAGLPLVKRMASPTTKSAVGPEVGGVLVAA